jgi:hypothetical protein
MLKISKGIAIAVISLLIISCGGGSSTSNSTSSAGGDFTSSAGAGEILTFSVDTTALTYSYIVTASSYGLTGQTGSGTLTKNSDGSYSPSEFPTSRIQVYQNGIMIGAVALDINGQTVDAPVVGLSSPITSVASLAGTYNFLGETCEGPVASSGMGVGDCNTVFGTLVIDPTGTYKACTGADLTADAICSSGTLTSGDVVSAGNGLFEFNRDSTVFTAVTNANYLLASAASNGQNVLIIDTNDSGAAGFGYGHLVGSTQTTNVDTVNAQGTWTWNANNGDSGTFDLTCSSSTVCTSSSGPTITIGNPWAGLGTVTNGGFNYHVLMAGTGVYVQAAVPSQGAPGAYNIYMEVGAHQ